MLPEVAPEEASIERSISSAELRRFIGNKFTVAMCNISKQPTFSEYDQFNYDDKNYIPMCHAFVTKDAQLKSILDEFIDAEKFDRGIKDRRDKLVLKQEVGNLQWGAPVQEAYDRVIEQQRRPTRGQRSLSPRSRGQPSTRPPLGRREKER